MENPGKYVVVVPSTLQQFPSKQLALNKAKEMLMTQLSRDEMLVGNKLAVCQVLAIVILEPTVEDL